MLSRPLISLRDTIARSSWLGRMPVEWDGSAASSELLSAGRRSSAPWRAGSPRSRLALCGGVAISLDRLDDVLDHLLRVAEHHHRLVHVEELVVEAGVARRHRPLVDDDGLGLVGLAD